MTPLNDDTAVIYTLPVPGDPDDPRADDLATELAKAAPRRWWNRGTLVLGSVVLLLGGFLGGLQAQKQWGTAATPAAGARGAGFAGGQNRAGYGAAGAFGGQGAPAGAAPTAAAAASGTTGTVKLVNGTTIYVQTADGDVVTVKTDGKTSVSSAGKIALKDVKAGQSITVQGAAGTDGTVTATSVTTQKK
ncbi:hypothetical protein ACWKSP_39400 [Micromonosporaceae bacterium Da 78-11]